MAHHLRYASHSPHTVAAHNGPAGRPSIRFTTRSGDGTEGLVEMANPAAALFGVTTKNRATPSRGSGNPSTAIRSTRLCTVGARYLPEGFDQIVSPDGTGPGTKGLPRITIRDTYGGTLGAAVLLQDV